MFNVLYSSTILQSPVLGKRLRGNESRDAIIGCVDTGISIATDFALNEGGAHIFRSGGAYINAGSTSDGLTLSAITNNSTKRDYKYWVMGHHDCKFAATVINSARDVTNDFEPDAKQMFGEDASLVLEAIRTSRLNSTQMQDPLAMLLALKSAANVASYGSVQCHIDRYGASIVPAFVTFNRGAARGFPDKKLHLYDPTKEAFFTLESNDRWVRKIGDDRSEITAGQVTNTLQAGILSFADRIKTGKTSKLIIAA